MCVCVCVCACVRACVRACVCACVCALFSLESVQAEAMMGIKEGWSHKNLIICAQPCCKHHTSSTLPPPHLPSLKVSSPGLSGTLHTQSHFIFHYRLPLMKVLHPTIACMVTVNISTPVYLLFLPPPPPMKVLHPTPPCRLTVNTSVTVYPTPLPTPHTPNSYGKQLRQQT